MYLTDMMALSHVPRWAIVSHFRPQNVADHSFRVLVIFAELADKLQVKYTRDDLLRVMAHDIDEARTGDIPTPAKIQLGIPPCELNLSNREVTRVFSLADMIEAFTFIEKCGYGTHARRVAMQLRAKIGEIAGEDEKAVNAIIDAIAFETSR